MRGQLRDSGIGVVGKVPWGTHVCHFYRDPRDAFSIMVPYIKGGLEGYEYCLCLVPDDLFRADLLQALKASVPDVKTYLDRGQLVLANYADWYAGLPDVKPNNLLRRLFEAEKHGLDKGFNSLRAAGIAVEIHQERWNELISYEAIVDMFIRKHKIIALCSYALGSLDTAQLLDINAKHDMVLVDTRHGYLAINNSRLAKTRSRKTRIRKTIASNNRYHRKMNSYEGAVKLVSNILTVNDVATLLNVHVNTVRHWSNSGILKSQRISPRGDRRFLRKDIDDFLKSQTRNFASEA